LSLSYSTCAVEIVMPRVVALVALVLDVRRRDRDAARLLFRRLVDLIERRELREALRRLDLRDRSGQRGLAVIDVTDRSDVDVGLVADEFLFGHERSPRGLACREIERRR